MSRRRPTRWSPWSLLALAAALGAACDDAAPATVASGMALPERWSTLERELGDRAVAFEPRFPLWTDGLDKARTITRPEGADPDEAWPVGTVLTKTFAAPDGPIETRVSVVRDDGWEFAIYLWDEDGAEARLSEGGVARDWVDDDGAAHTHEVPSLKQCDTCHATAPHPALGLTALQRGEVDLPAALTEPARAAAGWVVGNCTHCHHGGAGVASAFDLRPDVFVAHTVCAPSQGSGSGIGWRIVPGDPQASMLLTAIAGGDAAHGIKAMPPLGVTRRDPDGLAAVERWVRSLSPTTCKDPEVIE